MAKNPYRRFIGSIHCSIPGCSNLVRRRGLCAKHYDTARSVKPELADPLRVEAHIEIADLQALAKTCLVKPWRVRRAAEANVARAGDIDNVLEIDIFDLHLGKLAWAKETGYEHYDLDIAQALFAEALETLIRRTSMYHFNRILFPIGNDFFHTDNLISETTAGTRQDSDGRYHKTARIARQLVTNAIERLRQIAPVDVLVVSGNHDTLAAWHLGDSLECYYHSDADISIDNEPTLRKYYEFGDVMLMITHGNRGKQLDYPLLMATEQPEMWGRTCYREIHLGHLHQTQLRIAPATKETHGVRTRILSSLCAVDAWHAEHQFVGNQRAAEAFVWNRSQGLIAQATYTVPREA